MRFSKRGDSEKPSKRAHSFFAALASCAQQTKNQQQKKRQKKKSTRVYSQKKVRTKRRGEKGKGKINKFEREEGFHTSEFK
jgi:hypothetical protein